MSRDDATVLQIAEAARLVRAFVEGMDRVAFTRDIRTRSAVLYQLLVIGEAAKRLSEPFRREHEQIPWRAVAGMRDRLIHGYEVVDVDLVWQTAQGDVAKLLQELEPLIPTKD